MLCPYCHVAYTTDQPCFCQPYVASQKAGPDTLKIEAPEGRRAAVSALHEDNLRRFEMEVFPDGGQ